MIRKFNYTGRVKIQRKHVLVSVVQHGSELFVNTDLRLDEYAQKLPLQSKVYVEAYLRHKYQRFRFGTLGSISEPDDRRLNEFNEADAENIRFNVKIVDGSDAHGQILALARGVGQVGEDELHANQFRLLGTDYDDLGDQIWCLRFEDDRPYLVANIHIPEVKQLLRTNGLFFSLVYPEIVEKVLEHVLLTPSSDYTDTNEDEPGWQSHWVKFAKEFNSDSLPSLESGQRNGWITDCVRMFCRKHKALDKFLISIKENAE